MLTQAELDSMRETLNLSLPDEASILRRTLISDGQGGKLDAPGSPAPIGTYPARLSPLSGKSAAERAIADRLGSETAWILTLPWGTPIELADYASVMLHETLEIRTFEVVNIMDPRTYNIATRVALVEVK